MERNSTFDAQLLASFLVVPRPSASIRITLELIGAPACSESPAFTMLIPGSGVILYLGVPSPDSAVPPAQAGVAV